MKSSALAAALLALVAACGRGTCPQPSPKPVTNGSLGDPCLADGNCAEGLACRPVFVVPGYSAPVFTANACTIACDAGCGPAGACATLPAPQRDGGVETLETCLGSCQAAGDCVIGTSVGTCEAGACIRLQCTSDAQCPSGSTCEIPAVVCCPPGAKCEFSGPVPGYCRRSP